MNSAGNAWASAAPEASHEALLTRLESRQAVIGIVRLGYVGLPLSLCACEAGFRVIGYDLDEDKVRRLNDADSRFAHIRPARVAALQHARFTATVDPGALAEADAVLICVPTPLGPHREPDLSYVEQTGLMLAGILRPGQLVVLESTTYPGTTRDVLKPILESSGLWSSVDFFQAYPPEREDPGNAESTPR